MLCILLDLACNKVDVMKLTLDDITLYHYKKIVVAAVKERTRLIFLGWLLIIQINDHKFHW